MKLVPFIIKLLFSQQNWQTRPSCYLFLCYLGIHRFKMDSIVPIILLWTVFKTEEAGIYIWKSFCRTEFVETFFEYIRFIELNSNFFVLTGTLIVQNNKFS